MGLRLNFGKLADDALITCLPALDSWHGIAARTPIHDLAQCDAIPACHVAPLYL